MEWELSKFTRLTWGSNGHAAGSSCYSESRAGQAGEKLFGSIIKSAKADAKSCGWDVINPEAPQPRGGWLASRDQSGSGLLSHMAQTSQLELQPGPITVIRAPALQADVCCTAHEDIKHHARNWAKLMRQVLLQISQVVQRGTWLPALLHERNKDTRERRNGGSMTLQSMPLAQPVAASLDQGVVPFLAGVSPLPWAQPRSPSWGISLLQQPEGISVPLISVKVHVFHYLSPSLRALCPAPCHCTGKGAMLLLKFWDDQSSASQGVSSTGSPLAEPFIGGYARGRTDMDVLARGTSCSLRVKNSVLTALSSPPLI